jgi:hypothetical protein
MLHNRVPAIRQLDCGLCLPVVIGDTVRRRLLELAEKDPRITGAAVTGSAADGNEDRWSDIDLFFGVGDLVALDAVVSDWSSYLYASLGPCITSTSRSPPPSTMHFSCRPVWRSTLDSPRPTGSVRLAPTFVLSSVRRSRYPRPPDLTPGT